MVKKYKYNILCALNWLQECKEWKVSTLYIESLSDLKPAFVEMLPPENNERVRYTG
jgi:hypothetical protein